MCEDGSVSKYMLQWAFSSMSPVYFGNEAIGILKSVVRKDVLCDDVFGVYYPALHEIFTVTIMGTNSAMNFWSIPAEPSEVIPLLQALATASGKMKGSSMGFPAIQPTLEHRTAKFGKELDVWRAASRQHAPHPP